MLFNASADLFFSFYFIFLLLDSNLAAVFKVKDDFENLPNHYEELKSKSVYPALILSLSMTERRDVCKDILSSQYYRDQGLRFGGDDPLILQQSVADSNFKDGISHYPIIIEKLELDTGNRVLAEEELFFGCICERERVLEHLEPIIFYVSYAFETNSFYTSVLEENTPHKIKLRDYIALSPEHVPYDENELEDYYVNIRRTLKKLETESPTWFKMVEENDDISTLSDADKVILCASVLGTQVYLEEGIEFLVEYNPIDFVYYRKPLHLNDEKYAQEDIQTINLRCSAFNKDLNRETLIYLTPSYNNENSVFSLKKGFYGEIKLDKYFRKIPVLTNAKYIRRSNQDENLLLDNFPESD